ncbi:MAG: hypothetical protein ABIN01_20100, partial [Ferruginibacter sp.]
IEQPKYDCSLDTTPLPDVDTIQKESTREAVIANSRALYAASREDVETLLYQSFDVDMASGIEKHVVPEKPPILKQRPVTAEKAEGDELHSDDIVEIPQRSSVDEVKNISTHRYLQTLVKRMAEAHGYTATIEMSLPDGSGQVDVLLAKDGKRIAVEICNTTDAEWEMHNILKCIQAGYELIVSLSGDIKQLERIKKKCITGIAEFEKHPVLFYTPDTFFSFLDESVKEQVLEQKNIKGYRVKVSYDAISKEEMDRKRASVTNIILNTMRKQKKKKKE